MTMQRILSGSMAVVCLLSFATPILPFALFWLTAAGGAALAFSILYALIAGEKLYAMFFRLRTSNLLAVGQDWTSVAVAIAYVAAMYAAIIEFYLRGRPGGWPWATAVGLLAWALAVGLRYWAFVHLGRQWAVHVDRSEVDDRHLVRSGPYAWIRHPLYVGAMLECLAVPLIFGAFWAVGLALLTFVPLEIKRARFEERFLRQIFGDLYERYRQAVPGFLPRLRGGSRQPDRPKQPESN